MTKYKRITGKVFGGNATATGDDPQIAQFGSGLAGTFIGTTDVETIQQLPAWGQGWIGAVTPDTQYPALPEMTGAMKVLSHQICTAEQEGVSSWDSGTVYYDGNFVSKNKKLYVSVTNENQGNDPETDETNWQEYASGGGSGGGYEICDIGLALFVDESEGKRRYLNGQIVAQNNNTQKFINKLVNLKAINPSLFDTEENWQAAKTLSDFGQVGKFVLNYASDGVTVESVRLPAVVNIQGLFDLQNLGMTVKAGLPDYKHTHSLTLTQRFGNAFTGDRGWCTANGSAGSGSNTITETTSENPIFGRSNTVQIESIQYPYFIQIATGSTSEVITNQLEIPAGVILFEPKYSSTPLYDARYGFKGSSFPKTLYQDTYNALLVEVNPDVAVGTTVAISETFSYTKRGEDVKESNASDITEYSWVINRVEETFTTPSKTRIAGGKAVVGNGMAVGLTDGTTNYGMRYDTPGSDQALQPVLGTYGKTLPSFTDNPATFPVIHSSIGITLDWTKSGIETSDEGLYLYFCIATVGQNAAIVNLGRMEEQIILKTDAAQAAHAAMPSDRYINLVLGASGDQYTAPSDGYFWINKRSGGSNEFVNLGNDVSGYIENYSVAQNNVMNIIRQTAKGETIRCYYNLTGATEHFRFIYAKGAE